MTNLIAIIAYYIKLLKIVIHLNLMSNNYSIDNFLNYKA